jgi:SAM-dependent methyltransferase
MAWKRARKTRAPARLRRSRPTQAALADRHALYERAVLPPDDTHAVLARIFRRLRSRAPKLLREDFCGTARLCRTWCLGARDRRAIGVDMDGATLAVARRRNLAPFAAELGGRMQLVRADVLEVGPGRLDPADLIVALNFSFCVFKQRDRLRRYLANALGGLARDGVLILELFGGSTAMDRGEERHELGDVTYRWEQVSFDPLTNTIACHIHFEFPDGSTLHRAFSYDWRLWSVPELRDLLLEVGFSEVKTYWEATAAEGTGAGDGVLHGSGRYAPRERAEQQDCWLVYVVALR